MSNKESRREAIFNKYQRLIPYLCQKITSKFTIQEEELEDIISEAYLTLWNITDRYDDTQEFTFKTYLYIRIKGSILDSLRKRRKHLEQAAAIATNLKTLLENQDDTSLESRELVEEIAGKLSPKEALIIHSYYFQEKTFTEIAAEHPNLSKSWISKIHKRTLKKLNKAYLQEMLDQKIA